MSDGGLYVKCPTCRGDGWTSEHAPNCSGVESFCVKNCPVQVQCETCFGEGRIIDPSRVR